MENPETKPPELKFRHLMFVEHMLVICREDLSYFSINMRLSDEIKAELVELFKTCACNQGVTCDGHKEIFARADEELAVKG